MILPGDLKALAAAISLAATASTLARPEFIPLEPPPGVGSTYVYATDGVQQVGSAGDRACFWTGTSASFVSLASPGSLGSCAYGVDAGRQVGWINVPQSGQPYYSTRAALWTGTRDSCVQLASSGSPCRAYGISGETVVGSFVNYEFGRDAPYAILWSGVDHAPRSLGSGAALAVSGTQAVGWSERFVGGGHYSADATMWSTTAPFVSVQLGPQTGISQALAASGNLVVGTNIDQNGLIHAAIWDVTTGVQTMLRPAGLAGSVATAVCADKQVGYAYPEYFYPDYNRRACMWRGTTGSYVDLRAWLVSRGLDLTGWVLTEATGVSPDGTMIVGNGTHNGVNRGWIIRLFDEPTNPDFPCTADLANGSFPASRPDGAVTVDDLVYFLRNYLPGRLSVDLDDGSGFGYPDGAVTIDDLLYFLRHFEQGC